MIKSRMHRLYIEIFFLPVAITTVFTLLFCGVGSLYMIKPRKEKPSVSFSDRGQAVTDAYLTTLFEKGSIDIKYNTELYEFPMGSELYLKEQGYLLRQPGNKQESVQINPEYPLFMDGGRYLYLYHEKFHLITEELISLTTKADTYISEGKLFNEQGLREGDYDIFLLKLPNGLYINPKPLKLENGSQIETIQSNSILQIAEDTISYCSPFVRKPQLQMIQLVDSMAMLQIGEDRVTYDGFFEAMTALSKGISETLDTEGSETKAFAEAEKADILNKLKKQTLEKELYQFFLGVRYDYRGTKNIFWSKDGYFCEMGENRFYLPEAPIYYTDEDRLLLPKDYVLLQPKLFLMNKLPAMTEINHEDGLTYTRLEEQLRTYSDLIIYDGADTYLFFETTELTWGEEAVILSPLSYAVVTVEGLEVYDYDSASYQRYQVEGTTKVLAATESEVALNLSDDILYRPDGQEQILFSTPSLLEKVR